MDKDTLFTSAKDRAAEKLDSGEEEEESVEVESEGGNVICEELKEVLSGWDDDHPYYEDIEKIIEKHDGGDTETEEEEEYEFGDDG